MFGADLVVSAFCLARLNDTKKRYLYKAVADRLLPRGAFVIADDMASQHPLSRPSGAADHAALFHHLVWLKHAGFTAVDCVWADKGRAVMAGVKQAAGSAAPLPAGS